MRVLGKAILTLGLCMALAACGGWHLRGSGEGSSVDYRVYLKDVNATTVGQSVRRELVNRGARIVAKQGDADVVMEVVGQRYQRRILSVDPGSGKVREIELALTTQFQVRGIEGKLLIPRETVNWQIDYIFDESSVLGTTESDSIVQRDLADIAATTMVLRMHSAYRSSLANATQ